MIAKLNLADLIFKLRIKLASFIFPSFKYYADVDIKTQVRKIALEEATQICDAVADKWDTGKDEHPSYPTGVVYGARLCASSIDYRIQNSNLFRDKLIKQHKDNS